MTQEHPSSGIPMPPLSYLSRNRLATRGRTRNSSHFGAAMKDQSQNDVRNPYSLGDVAIAHTMIPEAIDKGCLADRSRASCLYSTVALAASFA
jgi:hypothetical protein